MALVRSDVIINQETSQFKITTPGLSTQCVKIVCVDCWSHFGDSSTGTEVMNLISSAIILHFILHDHGHARTWSLVTGVTVCLCTGFKSCVARHTWCCGGTPTSSSPSSPWCCSVASPSFSPWMTSATSARPWPWRKQKRRHWPIFWNSSATPMVIPGPQRWTGFSTICHTSAVASEPVGRSRRLWTKWTCHQCGREGWGGSVPIQGQYIFTYVSFRTGCQGGFFRCFGLFSTSLVKRYVHLELSLVQFQKYKLISVYAAVICRSSSICWL